MVCGCGSSGRANALVAGLVSVTARLLQSGRTATTMARVAVVLTSMVARADAATTVPPDFLQETVASGLTVPVDMSFLPDGRMLVAEHSGLIKLIGPAGTTTFLDIRSRVNNYGERGLLGIAVDPLFQQNHFVYTYYVHEHDAANPTGPKTARLSQFLTVGDTADPTSETVLLGSVSGDSCANVSADCIPSDFRDHHGGTIRFAANGTIFLSTGDGQPNGVSANTFRSQNLDSLDGKILHVDRAGRGLAANPFWTGTATDNRSKVWAYGLRNPFRFGVKPSNSIPYVGDVGWETTEEIDVALPGRNFGWPCYEGTPRQPGFEPQAICQALYAQGPSAVTAPLVSWPHTAGGGSATGGDFYTGTQFPLEYHGAFFFADYVQNWIAYLQTGADESLISGPTTFATGTETPVDLENGPDGSLYYVTINPDISGNVVGTGEIRRIRYTLGNRPPVVVATGTPTNGLAPLDVMFSSVGTSDPDDDPVSLDWDFGDGSPHSTASAPAHRYGTNGTYTVRLTANDGRGGQASAQVVITVGNRAPTPIIAAPAPTFRYAVGDVVNLIGTATDPDAGDTVTLGWVVTLQHCPLGGCHAHPFLNGPGPTLSFVVPDHGDDTYFSVGLTATDSGGLSATVTQLVQPQTALLALETQPIGLQLVYDGITVTAPATRTVIVGSTHQVRAPTPQSGQVFSSWEDASPNERQLIITTNRTVTRVDVGAGLVDHDQGRKVAELSDRDQLEPGGVPGWWLGTL
jgi:glucose/arabinose dehydrogenase